MAHVWLGLALLEQGRFREATERNLRVYRLDPLAPIVVTNAGFDALRFGQDDEARARFQVAIDLDPQFPVPLSGMARLEATRGRVREALRWVDRAIEVAPSRGFYRARRALLLQQLGRPDEADAAVEDARRLVPANRFDVELVIALRIARNDRAALERIASGAAGGAYGAAQRAYACIALDRLDEAHAWYERATLNPGQEIDDILNDEWVWRLPHSIACAHLCETCGEPSSCRERLLNFVGRAEGYFAQGIVSGDIRYWVATACLMLGRIEEGIAHLETAVAGGWRHGWWARLDWNLRPWLDHPRVAAAIARAEVLDGSAPVSAAGAGTTASAG
jgi:Flp pilus assembly protein TadD